MCIGLGECIKNSITACAINLNESPIMLEMLKDKKLALLNYNSENDHIRDMARIVIRGMINV